MKTKTIVSAFVAFTVCSGNVFSESLWKTKSNATEKSMYSDRRAASVGDILTVVISESTTMNKQRQNAQSSNTTASFGLGTFKIPFLGIGGATQTPEFDYGSQDSFSGDGSIADSSSINSNLAVMVVDRLPNGNLVIEGAKQVDMSGEIQYAIVRGIIRGDDITTSNTVDSSLIANAQVQFMSKGELEKNQTKGLIPKLLDPLNIW